MGRILTWKLQGSNPLPNGTKKLPLMVSQWPPVLPKWSILVQFDFQQKHAGPAKDSPLNRESSTKCLQPHRGWLCIKVTTQLKTSDTAENIGKHLKSSDIILRTTEDPSQMIQFSLKRISTVRPKSWWSGGVDGYLRPEKFLDHGMVITNWICLHIL